MKVHLLKIGWNVIETFSAQCGTQRRYLGNHLKLTKNLKLITCKRCKTSPQRKGMNRIDTELKKGE